MANKMIERVARLISEEDRAEANEAPDFADWHWEERAELAQRIIHALQEPTSAMIEDGATIIKSNKDAPAIVVARGVFRAMLRQAEFGQQ